MYLIRYKLQLKVLNVLDTNLLIKDVSLLKQETFKFKNLFSNIKYIYYFFYMYYFFLNKKN